MILYRQTAPNYPFLWESAEQPAMRWHAQSEGPAHYFATTADGAWAEFLRHEEITDPRDLEGIHERAMWVLEVVEVARTDIDLPDSVLTGGTDTWTRCQREASRLREERGVGTLRVPSAALRSPGATVYRVDAGVQTEDVESEVVVMFGPQPLLHAQLAALGRPHPTLFERVRPLAERPPVE